VIWPLDPRNVGTNLPLEGLRVLDFSRVLAGPLIGMIAGDLGADVIKVEGPSGDPVRSMAPPTLHGLATYYIAVNRHRRNVVADLTNDHDRRAIAALIGEADAVIENFLPSQYEALNIGALRALNPDCVWVSVTPASSGTALAAEPSFDLLAQARSGLMGVTGNPESGPTKVGAPLADVVTGLYGTIGLLTGLLAKARQRPGRHFEAPLLESTMSALINQAQGYLSTGVSALLLGNEHPSIHPYGPVTTADGQLLLAIGTDGQFARLVAVVDDDSLTAGAAEWRSNAERVADRENLRSTLNAAFSRATTAQWETRLEGQGIPFAPIASIREAFEQDTIRSGDFVTTMTTPGGQTSVMRSPLRIDGVRPDVRFGPEALGQSTDALLGDPTA